MQHLLYLFFHQLQVFESLKYNDNYEMSIRILHYLNVNIIEINCKRKIFYIHR